MRAEFCLSFHDQFSNSIKKLYSEIGQSSDKWIVGILSTKQIRCIYPFKFLKLMLYLLVVWKIRKLHREKFLYLSVHNGLAHLYMGQGVIKRNYTCYTMLFWISFSLLLLFLFPRELFFSCFFPGVDFLHHFFELKLSLSLFIVFSSSLLSFPLALLLPLFPLQLFFFVLLLHFQSSLSSLLLFPNESFKFLFLDILLQILWIFDLCFHSLNLCRFFQVFILLNFDFLLLMLHSSLVTLLFFRCLFILYFVIWNKFATRSLLFFRMIFQLLIYSRFHPAHILILINTYLLTISRHLFVSNNPIPNFVWCWQFIANFVLQSIIQSSGLGQCR